MGFRTWHGRLQEQCRLAQLKQVRRARVGEALPDSGPRGVSSCQLFEQDLGLLQVEHVEAFGEPAVDRGEKIAGLIPLALSAP